MILMKQQIANRVIVIKKMENWYKKERGKKFFGLVKINEMGGGFTFSWKVKV